MAAKQVKKAPATAKAKAPEAKTTTTPAAPVKITKLQRHPLSEKFSLPTSEEERLALATDMESNGQHQEIILFEGMVLDGWERYMGCLQKGLTPLYKEYKGTNPAAVAFGANAIRRKLSSVQKALFGAKYFMYTQAEGSAGVTQKIVAKSACCSLQRLNEIVQLLRKADTDEEAARCVSKLNTNPDITTAMLQTMLADAGIVDPSAHSKPSVRGPDPDEEDDDGESSSSSADDSVDLLGGADIDDLLDGDDAPAAGTRTPTSKGDKGNLPSGRIGKDTRSRETPASAAAKHFKALTEPERIDFVKFAWSMLRPAVESCVDQGRIEWPRLAAHADAGKSAMADVGAVLAKVSKSSKAATVEAKTKAKALVGKKAKAGKPASVAPVAAKAPAKWRGPAKAPTA